MVTQNTNNQGSNAAPTSTNSRVAGPTSQPEDPRSSGINELTPIEKAMVREACKSLGE